MIHEARSASDRAAIGKAVEQTRIREHLMILEAEKNIAADINLNKLVDDYRSSLLVYNYEKLLIDTQLDTTIAETEKLEYYGVNKEQYILSHPILRCMVAKVPAKSSGVSSIKSAFNKSDLTEALFLVKEKASFHFIDTAKWLTFGDLNAFIPDEMIERKQLSKNKVFQKKEGDSEYFVKILSFYDEKQFPPFDYIEDRITKVILSDRKINLLKHVRQNLYDKAVSDKEIEIFKQK